MGSKQEAIVLEFLDKLHDPVHPDLGAALIGFADEATYQSLVPSREPLIGKAAIIEELSKQFGRYTDCVCEILAMASNEKYVFTERRDHITMLSFEKRMFSSVNAVFEFDDAGQIVSWREYWDTGDIASQLGLTSEQMAELHGIAQ
ncbi:MAG: putative terpene synthesis protein [Pseudonocardiales bacterium]|nr:putative terpene synthesis protein [Pseudonocardiales bacterium]